MCKYEVDQFKTEDRKTASSDAPFSSYDHFDCPASFPSPKFTPFSSPTHRFREMTV